MILRFLVIIFIFVFNIFLILAGSIIPGLRIECLFVKSMTVDSIPIFDFPPSRISLIFFLNSSATSSALTGLTPEEILAEIEELDKEATIGLKAIRNLF